MPVPGAVTDPSAVVEEAATVACADGTAMGAHLSRPAAGGPHPAVIVIHEAFGLNDHIRDLTRRFANLGYLALAPDLYHRVGAPDPEDRDALVAALFGVADADAVADLEAAAAHLRARPDASGPVGCIGFCSGGRHTALLACSSDVLDAAVSCWGGYLDEAVPGQRTTPTRPTPVIELADRLACPLLLVGGAEDANPSPALLADVAARARQAGGDVTVEVFDGAGHAFLADHRDSYREGPAHALWPVLVAFLDEHLASGGRG